MATSEEILFKSFDSKGDGQPYAILVTVGKGGNVEGRYLLARKGKENFWWGDLGLKAALRLVRKLRKTAHCFFPHPDFPASIRHLDYQIIKIGTGVADFVPHGSQIGFD